MIVFTHILEHLPEAQKTLEQMKAFLDEQGFLFIEVPNQDHLHKKTLEPHLYVFSEKGLTYLLGRAGYKLVDISLCGRLIEDLSQASNPAKAKSVSQLIRNLVPVTLRIG